MSDSLIKHLALATRVLNTPIAEEAIAANVLRDRQLNVDVISLQAVLRSYGFENNLSKRDLIDIPSLATPVVALLDREEALVIAGIEGVGLERVYLVYQGDAPLQRISHAKLAERYTGFCWFIKPKVALDRRSDLPEYHLPKAWFWKVIGRFKSYYIQVLIVSVLVNVLALVSSLYIMNVYDRVIPNKAFDTLWVLTIGVFLAIVFELIGRMIRAHLTDIAGKKADLIISSALFRRVMALRLVEKPSSSGSYANNLRDFEAVREFMTSAGILVLVDVPFLLLFVFVIYMIAGKLALVPLSIIPIMIIASFAIQPALARTIKASMKESSQRQGLAVEAIEGVETLKANNATSWAQQRWDGFTATTAHYGMKTRRIINFITNFSASLQRLNTVLLVLVGTYLVHSNDPEQQITQGAIIASVILSGRALAPLGQIAGLATRFQQARTALQGINAIVERPVERDPNRSYITLDHVRGELTFRDVAFRYDKDADPVLQGINLHIKPGEKVAIIGRIGSGKSTLLKLASGMYEPSHGGVSLDGVDVRQLDPNFLRTHIGLLNQSPRLFLGTLRENLDLARYGERVTDQDLLFALHRFNLTAWIKKHPKGLDMPLGEDGLGLSGGQKQMISLARLTLHQPSVVLLDEPTANLDEATEQQALQALASWARDKTLVVVTHRMQVLSLVDRVIVLHEGKVHLDGPRDAVLKQLQSGNQAKAKARGAASATGAASASTTASAGITATTSPSAETTSPGTATTAQSSSSPNYATPQYGAKPSATTGQITQVKFTQKGKSNEQ